MTPALMKERRTSVSPTDAERIVDHLRDPQSLGLVGDRLVEAAEPSEAIDHPDAFVDRYGRRVSESFVDPVGRQRREVVDGQGDRSFVVAPLEVSLSEVARGQEPELQVTRAVGNLQCAGAR